MNTEKEPKEELKEDLEEIELSYFDLVLIHWLKNSLLLI